jgi:hypothetical protein
MIWVYFLSALREEAQKVSAFVICVLEILIRNKRYVYDPNLNFLFKIQLKFPGVSKVRGICVFPFQNYRSIFPLKICHQQPWLSLPSIDRFPDKM